MKAIVIGLDGASFELIEPWMEEGVLPNIKKVIAEGVYGDMRSCLPPVTAPNWKCYSTEKNPGKLGIFWWENMSVPSKIHNIRLVKIRPEERLAATLELNLASCLVTGCGEAGGMGYWAATQVKGLSPEIFIVSVADVVHVTEGSTLVTASLNRTWRGDESLTGSETVARYQMDIMGTRETQSVLLTGVCPIKPINGKIVQMTLWESDQFIVPEKQGNACRGKGLAVEPLGQGHIHRTKRRVKGGNKTGLITYPLKGGEVLLKSRMRENLKSGSVRGLIAASGRRWL